MFETTKNTEYLEDLFKFLKVVEGFGALPFLNTLSLYLLNSVKHTKGFINFCFILGEFVGGFIISIYLYMGYFVCNMVWYMKDLLIMKNIFYKRKGTPLHIIDRYCRQL